MSTTELFDQLKQMSDQQRLELIEAATRLVRENLCARGSDNPEQRMRDAATRLRDLYEPGGELSVWTALDGEKDLNRPCCKGQW